MRKQLTPKQESFCQHYTTIGSPTFMHAWMNLPQHIKQAVLALVRVDTENGSSGRVSS